MEGKEKATPPVQKKIAADTTKRVNETVEKVYQDLDRSGFDRNSSEVKQAVREGVERSYVDSRKS